MNDKIVICVDPGLLNAGVTTFDTNGKILSSYTLKMTSKEPQESRLNKVRQAVIDSSSGLIVETVVVENQFVAVMSEIAGAIRSAAGELNTTSTKFVPSSWKKGATGKGNISESDLKDYIISVYPEAKDFDEHQIDCIGMFLAYQEKKNVKTTSQTKKRKKVRSN